jgi:hypothetical protein
LPSDYVRWIQEGGPAHSEKLPVQSDVPELLVTMAYQPGMAEVHRTKATLMMIAFYYLLWVGEYTVKGSQNKTSRQCSSNMRMYPSSKRTLVANSAASHAILLWISFQRLTAPLSSWIIKRTGGKEYVSTTSPTATGGIAQSALLYGTISAFATWEPTPKLSVWCTGMTRANVETSPTKMLARP